VLHIRYSKLIMNPRYTFQLVFWWTLSHGLPNLIYIIQCMDFFYNLFPIPCHNFVIFCCMILVFKGLGCLNIKNVKSQNVTLLKKNLTLKVCNVLCHLCNRHGGQNHILFNAKLTTINKRIVYTPFRFAKL